MNLKKLIFSSSRGIVAPNEMKKLAETTLVYSAQGNLAINQDRCWQLVSVTLPDKESNEKEATIKSLGSDYSTEYLMTAEVGPKEDEEALIGQDERKFARLAIRHILEAQVLMNRMEPVENLQTRHTLQGPGQFFDKTSFSSSVEDDC